MKIFYGTENLPRFRHAVVAVGSFDGVHLGHRQILATLKDAAAKQGGESVVVTYHPHPQLVLHPERDFQPIYTPEENAQLIAKEGIDNLILVEFTPQFSQLSPEAFVEFLSQKIGAQAIVMGPNHNFGKDRGGNSTTMREICAKYSMEIIQIPEFVMEENRVRSSQIRKHILNKEFTEAEKLLGHPLKKNR